MKTNAVQQSNSNTNTKKKDTRRTPSPKSTGKKNSSSPQLQGVCFSSSAFLNSPDPSALPIPIFDDEDVVKEAHVVDSKQSTNTVLPSKKTDTLRQFLNIRPAVSV